MHFFKSLIYLINEIELHFSYLDFIPIQRFFDLDIGSKITIHNCLFFLIIHLLPTSYLVVGLLWDRCHNSRSMRSLRRKNEDVNGQVSKGAKSRTFLGEQGRFVGPKISSNDLATVWQRTICFGCTSFASLSLPRNIYLLLRLDIRVCFLLFIRISSSLC